VQDVREITTSRGYDVRYKRLPSGDLIEDQVFRNAAVMMARHVHGRVDGRVLPGPFAYPGFMFYGYDTPVAPAVDHRDCLVTAPYNLIGVDMVKATTTWPRIIAPNGVDYLTVFDQKYPYTDPDVLRMAGLDPVYNPPHDRQRLIKLASMSYDESSDTPAKLQRLINKL
jgi:hypothetical protein